MFQWFQVILVTLVGFRWIQLVSDGLSLSQGGFSWFQVVSGRSTFWFWYVHFQVLGKILICKNTYLLLAKFYLILVFQHYLRLFHLVYFETRNEKRINKLSYRAIFLHNSFHFYLKTTNQSGKIYFNICNWWKNSVNFELPKRR